MVQPGMELPIKTELPVNMGNHQLQLLQLTPSIFLRAQTIPGYLSCKQPGSFILLARQEEA